MSPCVVQHALPPPTSVHERVFVNVEVTQSLDGVQTVQPQFVFKAFENVTEGNFITVNIFIRVQTKAFFRPTRCFQTSPLISEHNVSEVYGKMTYVS